MSKDGKQAPLDTTGLPELPRGWCWATVGELLVLSQNGFGKRRQERGSPTIVLRLADIEDGQICLGEPRRVNATADEVSKYALHEDDLIAIRVNGSPGLVGRFLRFSGAPEPVLACDHFIQLRFRVPEMGRYVRRFADTSPVRHFIDQNKVSSAGQNTVSQATLERVRMPVAPLNEQRRIVAKIEELFSDLDAGVTALQRVKAKLKRYRAAVLKAAVEGRLTEQWRAAHPVTEPASKLLERILSERRRAWEAAQLKAYAEAGKQPPANWKDKYREPAGPDETTLPPLPEGWCWATVDQLLYGIKAGKSFECLPRPASEDEWGVIKVSAMTWGEFLEGENKAIPSNKPFDLDTEIRPGDVLLSRSNTVQLVGATVLVKDCRRRLLLSDKSMRLLVNDLVDRAWFQKAMSSRVARRQLSAMATGTSDSMRNVSQEKVLSVALPLPPLEEQTQIVGEIEQRCSIIDGADSQVAANVKRSHRLRQAILKRAFEGKLVPQDPNDEPASVLLERIKTAAAASSTIHLNRKSAGKRPRRSAATQKKECKP